MSTPYKRTIQGIVIHHMGDGKIPEESIFGRWNPENYDYPEYDYGIEADGIIRIGRPLNIQGSHTLSDKPLYSERGYQWWNRNTIGIGLAGDFTIYSMPQTQFNALVSLVKRLMSEYGLTLDSVYPHGQVTYTDCPGCTYSKVPALTKGKWSYDEFERAVLKEEEKMLSDLVVYYGPRDEGPAKIFSDNKRCPIMPLEYLTAEMENSVENIYQVGGPKHSDKVILVSGYTALDTAQEVIDKLR